MKVVQYMFRFGLVATVALAATACGGAPAPQTQAWTGTAEFGGDAHALRVDVAVEGTDWSGSYTIGSAPPFSGAVVAELVEGVLTGQLVATSSCSFDLAGTVSAETLEAAFTPATCPGGEAGTWSATASASEAVE